MSSRYVRTPAGQAEIQARTLPLSRSVRNLLLVINDSRTIDDWLVQVHGVTAGDVAMLRAEGLITEAPAAAARGTAPAKPVDLREAAARGTPADDGEWQRARKVIGSAGYNALYDALNSVGKAKLGLVRGYRFVLEVEKCSGPDELRQMALKFADQLRAEHGMAAVGELADAIGAVRA